MTKKNTNEQSVSELMNKIKRMEAGHELDLSSDEDLSIAVMNLISIEEHLFFTAKKTGKDVYFSLLYEVREMRKKLLKMLVKDYEGEGWCLSKHLLASSMRLMEVGTKALGAGQEEKAKELFEQAWNLYNLFWAIALRLVDNKTAAGMSSAQKESMIKEIEAENKGQADEVKLGKIETKTAAVAGGFFGKLGNTIGKALDCCRE